MTLRRAALALLLLTLLGFALRLPLLSRFPLREDEAIYGYWALHGLTVDPLFLTVWPDKPPLFLWLLQGAFALWGHTPATAEPAARLLSILASTLTIPVLAVTARRWWGETAAVAAALLAALNPFAISFAPTAFTDPVLMLLGSLALACAVFRRPFWSGVWLGAAIMTKQQGLLFAPLVIGAWGLPGRPPSGKTLFREDPLPGRPSSGKTPFREALLFLAGLALAVLPILYWDSLRWAVAPSPWDLGATNVGGVLLAQPAAWPARAAGWGDLAWYLLASPWAWGAYALALLGAAVLAGRRRAGAREWLPALLLAAWAGGFLLLHMVTTVQVWDRYLLPLTIPLALLGGWAASFLVGHACSVTGGLARGGGPCHAASVTYKGVALGGVLFLLLAASPAWAASQGQLPVGGDHGAYSGLHEALAVVNEPGALLFHRELGWHARFALFDAVQRGAVELRYFPSSVYLADSATKAPHKQRFVIVPDWAPLPDLPLHLALRGLYAEQVLHAGHFTVYGIDERPAGDQSWRVCKPPGV